jgi:hypothetical protein
MVTGPDGGGAECEEDAVGEDPVRLAAGEGPVRLAMGEGDVPDLAVVIPTLHAARDRPVMQVITAMAVRRYVFIRCLSPSSLITASSKLGGHLAAGVAALSQSCDSERSSGTDRHRKTDAGHIYRSCRTFLHSIILHESSTTHNGLMNPAPARRMPRLSTESSLESNQLTLPPRSTYS